jgi:dUTP pyrophosphatase
VNVNKLVEGLTQQYAHAYINGQLPPGWVVGKITAVSLGMRTNEAVINVSASHPDRGNPVGIRLELNEEKAATSTVDELLTAIIAELGPKVRDAELRRSPQAIRFALDAGALAPRRGSERAAGYDLHALSSCMLNPGQILVVDTGVRVELPIDTNGEVRPRSGMSKRGLVVILGTIDEDYRGPIGVTLANLTRETQNIAMHDRIAQLVIVPVIHKPWQQVDPAELTETARAGNGWGSTGR